MLRHILTSAALFGFAFTVPVPSAATAQPNKKPPRRTQPATRGHTAPDVTATIPQQPAKPPVGTAPAADKDDEASLPAPFNLPTASRARMRACGESWQSLKMSGTAAGQTWRAYATECLAGKSGPDKAPLR